MDAQQPTTPILKPPFTEEVFANARAYAEETQQFLKLAKKTHTPPAQAMDCLLTAFLRGNYCAFINIPERQKFFDDEKRKEIRQKQSEHFKFQHFQYLIFQLIDSDDAREDEGIYKALEQITNSESPHITAAECVLAELHLNRPITFKARLSENTRRNNAFEWASRAALKNHPFGLFQMGYLYLKGCDKAPKDLETAERYFRLSAQHEFPQAMYYLGMALLEQNTDEANIEAKQWLTLAYEYGAKGAALSLGQLLRKKTPLQNFEEALMWTRLACESNVPNAREALAAMYKAKEVPVLTTDDAIMRYRKDWFKFGCLPARDLLIKLSSEHFVARYAYYVGITDRDGLKALIDEDPERFLTLFEKDPDTRADLIPVWFRVVLKRDAFLRLSLARQFAVAKVVRSHDQHVAVLQRLCDVFKNVSCDQPLFADIQAFLSQVTYTLDAGGYVWRYYHMRYCEAVGITVVADETFVPLDKHGITLCELIIANDKQEYQRWLENILVNNPVALSDENLHEFRYRLAKVYHDEKDKSLTNLQRAINWLREIPQTHTRYTQAQKMLKCLEKQAPSFHQKANGSDDEKPQQAKDVGFSIQ